MKHLLLTISIVVAFDMLHAQFIFTAKKPIKTNHESIDKNEESNLFNTIPFSAVRIIDSRYDTTIIGFFIEGFLTMKDSSHRLAIEHTINKYYHNDFTAGKDTLIIQLEKLSIQDRIIVDENLALTAGRLVCKEYSGGNGMYKYLGTIDTMMSEKYVSTNEFYIHQNSKKHINFEFWDFYLLRLCEAMLRPESLKTDSLDPSQNKYYSLNEIYSDGLKKRDKPILKDSTLKPGFYRNFSEFVNNEPTFLYVNDESLKKLLEVMHYRVDKKIPNEEPDTSYWGYCDGKRIFVRGEYNFFQLERRDAGFYIAASFDAKRRNGNKELVNFISGMLVLTTSIIALEPTASGFDMIHIPKIPMIKVWAAYDRAIGLQLDLDSGEVVY